MIEIVQILIVFIKNYKKTNGKNLFIVLSLYILTIYLIQNMNI